MPDLKSPPSASDSVTQKLADKQPIPDYANGKSSGQYAESGGEAHPAQPETFQQPHSGQIPSPSDSTVREPAIRPRSVRMQIRFWRTLIFAAWLFVRVLLWQIYVKRYLPNYVSRTDARRWRKYAREFRKFAINQGGLYIKLGQFISTRVDIFPEVIIQELASLQDEVPTVAFARIQSIIEQELGPIPSRFSHFDTIPIAAASLGQVHRARLTNGERVVVKVQRPGIRTICYTDLAAMRVVARVANRFTFISNRANVLALVEEFGKVLLEELSYKHEAYNAHRFAAIFRDDMGVYIPSVHNEHSTDQVLTLEDVSSIKITDFAAMERVGINRQVVARRLMDTYLNQIFNHFFFHADPHPGNLFVYPLPVEDERADFGPQGRPFYLIFVDFGMTGSLRREIADGIVDTMFAVMTRDSIRLVESYGKLGFLLPKADTERIIEATEATFDKVWGLTMDEIRQIDYDAVTDLAGEFRDLIFAMPFYIPQDFIYLGRTLSILSGMCTSLDPQYNPWDELQPYTESLIARGFGINIPKDHTLIDNIPGVFIQSLLSGNGQTALRLLAQETRQRLLGPIGEAEDTMRRLRSGDIQVTARLSSIYEEQLKHLERETRRTNRMIFFGSMLITSTLLYTHGDTTLAIIGYVICGFAFVVSMLSN